MATDMGDISYRGPLMWALSLPYGGEMCITIYHQDTSVSLPKEADYNILVGGRAHAASFLTAKAFSPWHVCKVHRRHIASYYLTLRCKTCRFREEESFTLLGTGPALWQHGNRLTPALLAVQEG